MYKEEKVIDGVLCFRTTPTSGFRQYNAVLLTSMLMIARDELEGYKAAAESLEADVYSCLQEQEITE